MEKLPKQLSSHQWQYIIRYPYGVGILICAGTDDSDSSYFQVNCVFHLCCQIIVFPCSLGQVTKTYLYFKKIINKQI